MKKNVLFIAAAVLAAAVVLYSLISLISVQNRLERSQEQIAIFMNQTRNDLGYINETQELMKQNTQQVRQYVSLPALNFPSREEEGKAAEDESADTGSFEIAAYDAVSYLRSYNRDFRYIQSFNAFLSSPEFKDFMAKANLTLKKMGDFSRILSNTDGKAFFNIQFDREEENVKISSGIFNNSGVFSFDDPSWLNFMTEETQKQKNALAYVARLNSQLQALSRERSFRADLRALDLYLGSPAYRSENLTLPIYRKDNTQLSVLTTDTADGVFRFQKMTYADIAGLKEGGGGVPCRSRSQDGS